jgi:hypothetical protein
MKTHLMFATSKPVSNNKPKAVKQILLHSASNKLAFNDQ